MKLCYSLKALVRQIPPHLYMWLLLYLFKIMQNYDTLRTLLPLVFNNDYCKREKIKMQIMAQIKKLERIQTNDLKIKCETHLRKVKVVKKQKTNYLCRDHLTVEKT